MSTMLGLEGHGIMSCYLHLEFQSGGCGFGGYAFDDWDKAKERRVGVAFGTESIMRILDTVGVEKWEDLKGKYIRVETEGWGGGIPKIGHIIKDKWFSFKELAKEMGLDDATN